MIANYDHPSFFFRRAAKKHEQGVLDRCTNTVMTDLTNRDVEYVLTRPFLFLKFSPLINVDLEMYMLRPQRRSIHRIQIWVVRLY